MTIYSPEPDPIDPNTPYIILGLGNPGDEYAQHRHNIGAQCVNLLAKRIGVKLDTVWNGARVAQGTLASKTVVLARTRTFMNQSGEPAAALLARTKAPVDHLIVLYDELDLPLGVLRLRPRGSAAGHNGLQSIIDHVGSQDFPRLRIGIDHPYGPVERAERSRDEYERDVVRWVLSPFPPAEQEKAQQARERAVDAVVSLLEDGIDAAMNRYNQRG